MPIEVPNREEWFPKLDAFPRPDWTAINDWMNHSIGSEHRSEAAAQITDHWLSRLLEAFGSTYVAEKSSYYILLSKRGEKQRKATLDQLERGRRLILSTLRSDAKAISSRPQVFIELDTSEAWDFYFATFDSEGIQEEAARIFFGPGAIPTPCWDTGGVAELAYRLVDHLFLHFPSPRWLRHGAVGYFTTLLVRRDFAIVEDGWLEAHREYWNAESIQDFWSGKTFEDVANGGYAENLAEVLVDIMMRELHLTAEKFAEFVTQAEKRDAGASATWKYFNASLDEVVSPFLGDGDWSPKPSNWR